MGRCAAAGEGALKSPPLLPVEGALGKSLSLSVPPLLICRMGGHHFPWEVVIRNGHKDGKRQPGTWSRMASVVNAGTTRPCPLYSLLPRDPGWEWQSPAVPL